MVKRDSNIQKEQIVQNPFIFYQYAENHYASSNKRPGQHYNKNKNPNQAIIDLTDLFERDEILGLLDKISDTSAKHEREIQILKRDIRNYYDPLSIEGEIIRRKIGYPKNGTPYSNNAFHSIKNTAIRAGYQF